MSSKINFILNNEELNVETATGKTLLDFLRKTAKLTGTKEGCREGDCGACTVLIGKITDDELHYKTVNSCLYPIGRVNGKHVVTIEGISFDDLTPIQQAYIDENASQCGFCTPGFIISTTGYLLENKSLNIDTAINAVAGNICRCTGYESIKRALANIIDQVDFGEDSGNVISNMISKKNIPEYFNTIQNRLKKLEKIKIKESNKNLIVGGGTDLYVQGEDDLEEEDPIFISDFIKDKIWKDGNRTFISGSTTFEEFANSEIVHQMIPNISEANKLFASLPIRNSATLAGNIINASPIGDMTIILLVLNAVIHLREDDNKREVPLREIFHGYKKLNKTKSEIIEKIELNLNVKKSFSNFEKISKRTHLDIASVNSAILIDVEDDLIISCGLSFGGVAPIPLYMERTTAYLMEKKLCSEILRNSLDIIDEEITPISDVRGSAAYKRLLAKQIFKSHFIKLFPEKISMDSFR